MYKFKTGLFTATLALLLGTGAANASLVDPLVTSVDYDAAPGSGQVMVVDFDNPTAANFNMSYSGPLVGIYQTPLVSGIAAPPFGDNSLYLAVLTGGTATLTTPYLDSLSIYIGSIDTYNQITFSGAAGQSWTYGGLDLYPPANGDQFIASTNRRFTFTFDPNALIDEVTFTSFGNSFEFDNIAVQVQSPGSSGGPGTNVPEPLTLSLFAAGLGGLGAMRRRKKKQA
jgi:hypothetical protein